LANNRDTISNVVLRVVYFLYRHARTQTHTQTHRHTHARTHADLFDNTLLRS